jgi:hypothetical protein
MPRPHRYLISQIRLVMPILTNCSYAGGHVKFCKQCQQRVMCVVVVGPLVLCQLRSSSHAPPFRQHNKAYTLNSRAGPPSYGRRIGGGNQQYLMVTPGDISCISCCITFLRPPLHWWG